MRMTMRFLLIALLAVTASAQPAKRALLIGIDDYTASTIPIVKTVEHRGWPDLQGAANDVRVLSEMLVLRYGFERKDIVTLTNQQATRPAILRAVEEQLGEPARIVDRGDYGPRPDERGALILASTQDLDDAYELRGGDGLMHGAFTWAWIRAMRDAVADEPAQDTFLRAQARLRDEKPYQMPAMLGRADARLRPFLGMHRRAARAVIAVESGQPDGDVILQGGWAHGLVAGSELRTGNTRLHITQLLGLGRSIARPDADSATIHAGALLEIPRRDRSWWFSLTSPPGPYRLAIRDKRTQQLVEDGTVAGTHTYSIVLRRSQVPDGKRYYYVVVVDRRGNSRLLFPRTGSVENRFPIATNAPPA